MTVNSYFSHIGVVEEQNLIEDLVIESIQMKGVDLVYIPKQDVNVDYLFNEDLEKTFGTASTIEMYLKDVEGFGGDGEMFSTFGLEINDQALFSVSKKRFAEEVLTHTRPEEGDLIYFPITKSLMEVKYVEHEDPFFQLGKQYVYELKCELYEFNDETFATGDAEVDQLGADLNAITTLADDPFADNLEIETEADAFIQFNPLNPFGE